MRARQLVLILLTLSVPASAQKAAPVQGPFASAKSFACSFPSFGTARWATGTPEVVTGSQDFGFKIDSIDFKNKRARIVADGNALASLLITSTGMNVIEQTPIGNLTMTTVFAGGGDGKTYRAVHSRHLGEIDGPPRTSQAYGSCQLE